MNQPRKPKGTPNGGQFAGGSNPESDLDLEDVLAPQSLVDSIEQGGRHAYFMEEDKLCIWTDGEDPECCGWSMFDQSGPVDIGQTRGGIVFVAQKCQICGREQDLSHATVIDNDTPVSLRDEVDAVLDSWDEIDEHRRAESV